MNRIRFFAIAALAFALILTACGGGTSQQGYLGTIKDRGKLIVGTSADYPPYESVDDAGNFVGFDMDLIREIGKRMGVNVEVKDMAFDASIAAVQEKKVDTVIAAMQSSPEREEKVDFSEPYHYQKDAFLTAADSPIVLTKAMDAAPPTTAARPRGPPAATGRTACPRARSPQPAGPFQLRLGAGAAPFHHQLFLRTRAYSAARAMKLLSELRKARLSSGPVTSTGAYSSPVTAVPAPTKPAYACGGGCPRCAGRQFKLEASAPGDRSERQADQVFPGEQRGIAARLLRLGAGGGFALTKRQPLRHADRDR